MRTATAFVGGALLGAAAHRLTKSLRPDPPTTFTSPDGVPAPGSSAFEEELSALTHAGAESGNALRLFDGRGEYLKELFTAIEMAETSLWLEVFWWRDGRFANEMTEALEAALRRGVDVRLMVDGFGAHNGRPETLGRLRRAGADVAVYAPVGRYSLHRLNKRTHRRILVVDHRVAYTGGVGIDDRWLGNEDDPPWKDVLLRMEGPGVRHLAGIFCDHWRIVTGDPLAGAPALRKHRSVGDANVQVLHSGPQSGAERMRLVMLYALESAQERVRIVTPYFIPDALMLDRLVACRQRGVDVELVLPSRRIDHQVVRRASRSYWGPLLRAGVRILEHQPTLVHTKALLVDDAWCLIGSMNVDERSFRLNAEIAVGTADRGILEKLGSCIDRYVEDAEPITLEDWQDRAVPQRAVDKVAGLLSAQL